MSNDFRSLIGTAVTLVLSAFTVRLADGREKELSAAGSLIGAAALIAVYFVHTKNVYVWLIFYGISYIGLAMFNLVCWAMITDVIDDTQVRTGQRPDEQFMRCTPLQESWDRRHHQGLSVFCCQ